MATQGDIQPTGSDALLLQLLRGGKGNTTTETTSSNISSEGVNALLRGILEGTSGGPGLAGISSGARRAGIYNSTTAGMLRNDLMARAAGEVAKAQASTTRTTTTGGKSRKDAFADILAMQAMKKAAKMGEKMFSSDKKGKQSDSDTSLEDNITAGLNSIAEKLGLVAPSSTSTGDGLVREIAPEQAMSFPATSEAWDQLFNDFEFSENFLNEPSAPVDFGTDFGDGPDTYIPPNDESDTDYFYDLPEDDDGFGFFLP